MKIISHRGNIFGLDPKRENAPEIVEECIDMGFDVEVDVWLKDNMYYLGHDMPKIPITKEFLLREQLWCHAKNLEALYHMLKDNIHCFWHQEDDFTLTSRGVIWTYPGKEITDKSILVTNVFPKEKCYGICTDFPFKMRNEKNS
jgi:hypothetical protein